MPLIDLTHPLAVGMPTWPTHPCFCRQPVSRLEDGDVTANSSLSLSEHTGTHFDAPAHFIEGGTTIDAVPPDRFFGRMLTVDATVATANTALPLSEFLAFERDHGPVRKGDAVFFHFGWDRFWNDPLKFMQDWPGLSGELAAYLAEVGVGIVGTDCLSIDAAPSDEFPAHRALLGAGCLIGENFANLGLVPPVARFVTLPLRISGGSGAPLRAIAEVD